MKSLLPLFFALFIISCSDKNEEKPLIIEDIVGKWEFDSEEINSMELNKSNTYLITSMIDGEEEYSYGRYEIVDQDIVLDGFTMLNDVSIKKDEIKFSIPLPDQSESINFIGNKNTEKIETNDDLNDFFKTWCIVTENGEQVKGGKDTREVFITSAGTYYLHFENYEDADYKAYWQWEDIDNKIFCVSDYEDVTCEEKDRGIHILKLTETELVVHQEYDGEELTYVLEAI